MSAKHQEVTDMIVEQFISSPVGTTDDQVADRITKEFINSYPDASAFHHKISKMISRQISESSMDSTISDIAKNIAKRIILWLEYVNAMSANHQKVADMIVEEFISSPVTTDEQTTDKQVADRIAKKFITRYADIGATHRKISDMIFLQITASSMDSTISKIANTIAMQLIVWSVFGMP